MMDRGRPGDSVVVSQALFLDLLPRIGDLAQSKAVMMVAYFSADSDAPGVDQEVLLRPGVVQTVVGGASPEPGEARMKAVLDRAVANGTLLRIAVGERARRVQFLLASPGNRALVRALGAGDTRAATMLRVEDDESIAVYRPNVYAVYEQHIGPLTPLVAESLRSAERSYPRDWLEEAIREASRLNHRSWRYV